MSFLPELRESEAVGETAATYAEIKRLGGVPMVALIYRHFATLPGALEWFWDAVGPAWRNGMLQEAAWRVAKASPLPPCVPFDAHELAAAGVDAAARAEIGIVLEAYNRANPENMLSMLCVVRLLEGAKTRRPLPARDWTPPGIPQPLAPMGDVATMPPEVSAMLDRVATAGDGDGPRVIQSLYRHFLHRPAFLALVVDRIAPRIDDGNVPQAVAALSKAMAREADALVKGMAAPPAPHPGIAPVATRFSGGVIPQMIVVGRMISSAVGR